MRLIRHAVASLVVVVTLCLLIGIATVAAQGTPDPNEFYFLGDISYRGSACPQGSVDAIVSEDGLAISIFFDESTGVGPHTRPMVTKRCRLLLPLHIPPGWQYSLIELGYQGSVFLERGVRARQRSEYYFQGRHGSRFQSNWQGPVDRDYDFTDTVGIETHRLAWSTCNVQRRLAIKTQLRLDNIRARRNSGFISSESIDGEIAHIYDVAWRRCF